MQVEYHGLVGRAQRGFHVDVDAQSPRRATPAGVWARRLVFIALAPITLLCAALGCDRPAARPEPAPPPPAPPAIASIASGASSAPPAAPLPDAPPPRRGPAPLEAPSPLVALAIERHAEAVVSLPIGATAKRPVLIATHGNFDRPEWQCEIWRGIIGDRGFILCPRGVRRPDSPAPGDVRFTYPTNAALEREVRAALAALAARWPEHADTRAPVWVGFSLGAIMGVPIAARDPAGFPRLALIEGGVEQWTPEAVKSFATAGKRVLFVCSQPWCGVQARSPAERLGQAGVEAKIARSANVGHRYDGPVAEEAARALPWLLEGDARW